MTEIRDTREVVAVALAMLENRMGLIEGVRRLNSGLAEVTDPDDPLRILVQGVDSETDHFPLGPMRLGCADEYLQRSDAEMERYLSVMRKDILAACEEIVVKYGERR